MAADGRVVAAAALHGALVVALVLVGASGVAPVVLLALALAWASNTVAHIHIHTPIFRSRPANRILSLYLGGLLGYPQSLWRLRHLRHHAGARAARVPRPRPLVILSESLVIVFVLAGMVVLTPRFLTTIWLPATALGLALCHLQGRMEHLGGEPRGISCYGRVHNALWFNDGYHAEHHCYPGVHWSELPRRRLANAPASPLAPWLRVSTVFAKIVAASLDALERLVLRSRWLQRQLVAAHRRAIARILPTGLGTVRIIGGGLFPRSVLVFRDLAPTAHLEVVDGSAEHVAKAREALAGDAAAIVWRIGTWSPHDERDDVDLHVVPLAYRAPAADSGADLMTPGATPRLVHVWLWRRPPYPSAMVAWWLLKRVVLVPAR